MRMDEEIDDDIEFFEQTEKLTPRQRRYVKRYLETKSVGTLATEFGVAVETVRNQLREACRRIGLDSVRDLLPEAERAERRTKRDGSKKASPLELMDMIRKQEFRCAISGVEMEPNDAALDHKIPVSEGGSDMADNLHWVTKEVNKAKGTMSNEAFIAMCKRVAAWNS